MSQPARLREIEVHFNFDPIVVRGIGVWSSAMQQRTYTATDAVAIINMLWPTSEGSVRIHWQGLNSSGRALRDGFRSNDLRLAAVRDHILTEAYRIRRFMRHAQG